jgi:hypothetical protein
MGFVSPIRAIVGYQVGTDLIISSDSETSTTDTDYVKAKEFTIELKVNPDLGFNIQFDMKSNAVGVNAYAILRHNGSDIGVEQSSNTGAYQNKSQDITTENWAIYDTLELWIKRGPAATHCYVENFRVYAVQTPFVITQESV